MVNRTCSASFFWELRKHGFCNVFGMVLFLSCTWHQVWPAWSSNSTNIMAHQCSFWGQVSFWSDFIRGVSVAFPTSSWMRPVRWKTGWAGEVWWVLALFLCIRTPFKKMDFSRIILKFLGFVGMNFQVPRQCRRIVMDGRMGSMKHCLRLTEFTGHGLWSA